ncbi:MAG TPA: ATP-binding protein [Terracidiphilus sp.]
MRRLVETGLGEHLQLEYKSALYDDSDRGNREFLQDVCMFANSSGGILLIGVSERRDGSGQPTGLPDPVGALGIESANPEAVLGAYDARVTAAIEERLPLEMAAIHIAGGRRVLAIRVPDSLRKPHAVSYQGHIYFPGRRERQRYALSVREIKELTMRTASHLELTKEILSGSFTQVTSAEQRPYLVAGILPVFFEDFLVDLRNDAIIQVVRTFGRVAAGEWGNLSYSFDGIERRGDRFDHLVQFRRNGLLRVSQQVPGIPREGADEVGPVGIDHLLRLVVAQAPQVYEAAGIGPPYLVSVTLRIPRALTGVYPAIGGLGEEHTLPVPPGEYRFPLMQIDDLFHIDRILRPFCDQVHQMFGREGSPSFSADGVWIERRR